MPVRRRLLSLVLILSACGRSERPAPTARDESLQSTPSAAANAAPEADVAAGARGSAGSAAPAPPMALSAVAVEPAQTTASPATAAAADTTLATAQMLIRTGAASIEVDSLEVAVAQVRATAARLGGFIANTALSAGRDQVRSATLEVKIPAARFDDAVSGLAPIGHVETVNVTAEDVGEEYVDVAARVANARRLETRLIALLERSAARLTDVLAVERELARVREEIERAEGRMRYLRTRVATSTLSVTVHERAPLVGTSPTSNPIGEAFRDAWRNFVTFVAGAIAASGVLVPVAVIAALGIWLVRRWRRRLPPR